VALQRERMKTRQSHNTIDAAVAPCFIQWASFSDEDRATKPVSVRPSKEQDPPKPPKAARCCRQTRKRRIPTL